MPARRSVRAIRLALTSILLALPAIPALAQQTTRSQNDPRPVARAALREGEVTIDGSIDEAAWAKATPITELVQSSPDEGKPPSQKTELRILYDAGAIYIGARMHDSLGAKGVRSVLARRDQVMNGVANTDTQTGAFTGYTIDPDGAAGPAAAFVIDNPDFNFRSLRGTSVLRWEYRPGSTLYFVWTQQREGFDQFGDFDFSRDRSALFRDRPTNVFQVKATYWIGR